MVPVLSIIIMVICFILSAGVPLAMIIYFKKKYNASVSSFFIGLGVMLLFALVLEQIMHKAVLATDFGASLYNSTIGFALYGGLAAGIFEETGRFLAMKFVMKKKHGNDYEALMYGAGHGGFEFFVILLSASMTNFVYSIMVNTNQTELLFAAATDESTRAAIQSAIDELISANPALFLIAPLERVLAITAQIALSVLVWYAATNKKNISLYIIAILLHALLDATAGFLSKLEVPVMAIEGVTAIYAVAFVILAIVIWRKNHTEES